MLGSDSLDELGLYANDGDKIRPDILSYEAGTIPGEDLPAEWWNYLINKFTKNSDQSKLEFTSIIAELITILTVSGITPDAGLTNQIENALQKRFVSGDITTKSVEVADLNSIESSGFYRALTTALNLPESGIASLVINLVYNSTHKFQLACAYNDTNRFYFRASNSGLWNAWETISTSNSPNKSVIVSDSEIVLTRPGKYICKNPRATITLPQSLVVGEEIEVDSDDGFTLKNASSESSLILNKHFNIATTKGALGLFNSPLKKRSLKLTYVGTEKVLGTTFANESFPATTIPSARQVAWSPNGKYLAVAYNTTSPNLELYKYENSIFTLIDTIATGVASAWSLSWSIDTRYLAVSMDEASGTIIIYELLNDVLTPLSMPAETLGQRRALGFDPTGRYVACINTTTNKLRVYKCLNSVVTVVLDVAGSFIETLAWSPNGEYLATMLSTTNGLCVYYKYEDSFLLMTPPTLASSTVGFLAWSPDGERLYLATSTSSLLKAFILYQGLWTEIASISVSAIPTLLSVSPDGEFISVAIGLSSINYKIYKFINKAFLLVNTLTTQYAAGVSVWSRDSKILVTVGPGAPLNSTYSYTVFVREGNNFTPVGGLTALTKGSFCSFSPDGELLVVCCNLTTQNIQVVSRQVITSQNTYLLTDTNLTLEELKNGVQ